MRQIAAGIDIGTHQVKAVIAEEIRDGSKIVHNIIGRGLAESRGTHQGFIVNHAEVAASVKSAVEAAEKASGVKVKRAFLAVGGLGLGGSISTGSIVISRADLEISEREKNQVLEAAEDAIPPAVSINRKLINTIPIEYKIDGKPVWGALEGLKARELGVKALCITCLERHINDLIKVVEAADIEVIDMVAAPIAASFVTISKREKRAGCVLANLGAETLSIVVFENGTPVSLEVFPIGSNSITNDIALGMKISLDEAERLKVGTLTKSTPSKKKLDEIISARLGDCFELIETHLKKIGRNALLPAGIILTGGGASLPGIKEAAESSLKLPAKVAPVHFGESKKGEKERTIDSLWATAYGLTIVGFNAEDEQRLVGVKPIDVVRGASKGLWHSLSDMVNKFLP